MAKTMAAQPTVLDSTGYVAALGKRTDVETQLSFAREELARRERDERDFPERVLTAAAKAILSGDSQTAVASIAELRRDVAVLAQAVRIQTEATAQARSDAFQPICRDAKPEHMEAVSKLIAAGEAFLAAHSDLRCFISGLLTRGDGCELLYPMRDLGINVEVPRRMQSSITELKTHFTEYRDSK
jgi:hypothetical protein